MTVVSLLFCAFVFLLVFFLASMNAFVSLVVGAGARRVVE